MFAPRPYRRAASQRSASTHVTPSLTSLPAALTPAKTYHDFSNPSLATVQVVITDRVPELEGSVQIVGKVNAMSDPVAPLTFGRLLDRNGSRVGFCGKLVKIGLDSEAEKTVILFQKWQSVRC